MEEEGNPFRPGSGHQPPHLAGRKKETERFLALLDQSVITKNAIISGLRGIGKTVFLDSLRDPTVKKGWAWCENDLSEHASVNEQAVAVRLLTDLAVVASGLTIESNIPGFGNVSVKGINYKELVKLFEDLPGLGTDKLKTILHLVILALAETGVNGVVFAYDEAQTMSDHRSKDQYPLSLLLEVFQSVQRMGAKCLLVLTGLPSLFSKLVEARTYAERMFEIIVLDKLDVPATREAIITPIAGQSFRPDNRIISQIIELSGCYPYFVQFICREVYDRWIQDYRTGREPGPVHILEIQAKLDQKFFLPSWLKLTDRQRDVLFAAAKVEQRDGKEFTSQDVRKELQLEVKSISPSQLNQIFDTLIALGELYKHRRGKYSFALPLFGSFILREMKSGQMELEFKWDG